jgi:hypothetical protein
MYKTVEKNIAFTSLLTRRRWEDNIKMDLKEIEWGGVD